MKWYQKAMATAAIAMPLLAADAYAQSRRPGTVYAPHQGRQAQQTGRQGYRTPRANPGINPRLGPRGGISRSGLPSRGDGFDSRDGRLARRHRNGFRFGRFNYTNVQILTDGFYLGVASGPGYRSVNVIFGNGAYGCGPICYVPRRGPCFYSPRFGGFLDFTWSNFGFFEEAHGRLYGSRSREIFERHVEKDSKEVQYLRREVEGLREDVGDLRERDAYERGVREGRESAEKEGAKRERSEKVVKPKPEPSPTPPSDLTVQAVTTQHEVSYRQICDAGQVDNVLTEFLNGYMFPQVEALGKGYFKARDNQRTHTIEIRDANDKLKFAVNYAGFLAKEKINKEDSAEELLRQVIGMLKDNGMQYGVDIAGVELEFGKNITFAQHGCPAPRN